MNENEENINQNNYLSKYKRIIVIFWLSYIMAGIATGVFFSAIDPDALKFCVNFPEISRMGAYSIGFLLFWLLTSSTCLLADFILNPKKNE